MISNYIPFKKDQKQSAHFLSGKGGNFTNVLESTQSHNIKESIDETKETIFT